MQEYFVLIRLQPINVYGLYTKTGCDMKVFFTYFYLQYKIDYKKK